MTTVRKWTGHETRALREALRLSTLDFASRLGISERTITKWENGHITTLRPNSHAILDTMLATAPPDARERFEAALIPAAPDEGGFAALVEGYMSQRGMSVRATAQAAGYSDHTYLSRVLNGHQKVSPYLAMKLDRALGADGDIIAAARLAIAEAEAARSTTSARNPVPGSSPLVGTVVPRDALQAEADLFDTLELTRLAGMSDIGAGTIEALHEATDLLCRAYPTTTAATLRNRAKKRLKQVHELLGSRTTIDQHRELLVIAGWIAALLGCVHYDLGEREEAEAARQAAYQWAKQAGHGELMGWAFELRAWFSLVEGNYEQLLEAAQAGQRTTGTSNAGVQLTLQEAKGWAYLGDSRQTGDALARGAQMLDRLPVPAHREHHFAFDRTKWAFYASTCYAVLGENGRAEEHAREVIKWHTRPDGSSNAPMRVAQARIDLGIVAARRGDLDEAVSYGDSAFEFDRKSLADLVSRTSELDHIIQQRYRGEQLAREFHDRHLHAKHLASRRP